MTEFPYMQFFVADYLADTAHLSTIEHGAYMLLIMNYWQRGSLPNHDKKLAGIARMSADEWQEAKPTILDFFTIDGECLRHKRIDADLAANRAKVQKAQAAGQASGEARRNKSHQAHNDKPTPQQPTFNGRSTGVEQAFNERPTEAEHTTNETTETLNHPDSESYSDSELEPQKHTQNPPTSGNGQPAVYSSPQSGKVIYLDPAAARAAAKQVRNAGDELGEFVQTWNALKLPPEKRLPCSVPGIAGAAHALTQFTPEERRQALENYADIIKHRDDYKRIAPEYGNPYTFLAGGIGQYLTDQNPWGRCGRKQADAPAGQQAALAAIMTRRGVTV